MDKLLSLYYENNAKKLHTVIDQIFNKHYGGTAGKDMDEFYGIGTDVLIEIWGKYKLGKDTYDPVKGDFDGYVYRAISMAIIDEFKRQNRDKRVNKVFLLDDNGDKILDEKTGRPIKISVPDIRLDAPISDDSNTMQIDLIQSDFNMDNEISEISTIFQSEKVEKFLNGLPAIQREILKMKMNDMPVSQIKNNLQISDREYSEAIKSIKENRLISLFNKQNKNTKRKVGDKPMDGKIMLNDDDLIMDIDTTDNHRVDTVTLDSLLEDKASGELDCNYVSQRDPFQWGEDQVNKFYSRILNNQPIPEIVVCETVERGDKISYLVEGLQRMSYAEEFKENRIPIKAKGAEFTKIKYKKYEYEENGNKKKDENGRAIFTIEIFDITNKYYKDLPEFLQKRFDKYNVTVTRFFNCTYKMIDYHIRNYNNHEGMTKSHYGITNVSNKISTSIKQLSKNHPFFMNNVKCSNKSKKRGALEEMVARGIMSTFFIEDWKRECVDAFKFVDKNVTELQFEKFTDNVTRLSMVADRDVKNLFNTTNAHIWLAVFNIFADMEIPDNKFIDFMKTFENNMKNKLINGRTYNEVNKRNTKDKTTVKNKINVIIDLMTDYFHVSNEQKELIIENQPITAKDIVKEYVNKDVEDDEIELFEMMANDISEAIQDIDSSFLSDGNRPSFVALVGYADRENKSHLLNGWLTDFEKRKDLIKNQKKNFIHMRDCFEQYCRESKISA